MSGNETYSFLGVSFATARVSRVRIVSGNQVLAPGNITEDLVVMDDFIFGEPIVRNSNAVPDPTNSLPLLALAIASLCWLRLRERAVRQA